MRLRNKDPKVSKTPHPSEVEGNGHFTSDGGLDIYKLLWGLQGRVGRLEGMWLVDKLILGVVMTKLLELW